MTLIMTTTKTHIHYAGLGKKDIGYFDFQWIEGSNDENAKWVNVVYTSKSQVKTFDTGMLLGEDKLVREIGRAHV